jgi:hypothetical protein
VGEKTIYLTYDLKLARWVSSQMYTKLPSKINANLVDSYGGKQFSLFFLFNKKILSSFMVAPLGTTYGVLILVYYYSAEK